MTFKSTVKSILLLALAVSLSGCPLLPKPKFDPNDPNSSIVYGYFDTRQMKSQFEWVKIQGVAGKNDYVTADATKEGVFYHIAVRPGKRYISAFGGWNSSNSFAQQNSTSFRFDEEEQNGPSINIQKPGVHFMGSYKVVINGKSFDLQKTKSPSKKEMLKTIMDNMEKTGSKKFYPRQYEMLEVQLAKTK